MMRAAHPRRTRRLLIVFLAVALLPVTVIAIAHFVYDPLQLYRPSQRGPEWIHDNLRLQAPGIIRYRKFDSVLLGTSMMENMSASDASELFGGRFINLSLTASDFYERALVLEFLLRHKKIGRVIYSLDSVYLNRRIGYRHFPLHTFDFLYDRNRVNDLRVYFNKHFLDCLVTRSQNPACIGQPLGLDRPNAWFGIPTEAARFGGFENWCAQRDNRQVDAVWQVVRKFRQDRAERIAVPRSEPEPLDEIALSIDYVDRHLLRIVRAHPQVEFLLFFPPYSRLKYALWYQEDEIDGVAHRAVTTHLTLAQRGLPNLKVFGFENSPIPDDLSLYKDLDHYSPDVDLRLLRKMHDGTGRLAPDGIEAYLDEAVRRGRAYDVDALYEKFRDCDARREAEGRTGLDHPFSSNA